MRLFIPLSNLIIATTIAASFASVAEDHGRGVRRPTTIARELAAKGLRGSVTSRRTKEGAINELLEELLGKEDLDAFEYIVEGEDGDVMEDVVVELLDGDEHVGGSEKAKKKIIKLIERNRNEGGASIIDEEEGTDETEIIDEEEGTDETEQEPTKKKTAMEIMKGQVGKDEGSARFKKAPKGATPESKKADITAKPMEQESDKSETADKPEKAEKANEPKGAKETLAKAEKPEKQESSEEPTKPEKADKPETTEKPIKMEDEPGKPEKTEGIATPSTTPICPPHYNASTTTYAAGDTIESEMHIYQCQPMPYEEYCNKVEMDEDWNAEEKELWHDAWAHVSACEMLEVDVVADKGATEAPVAKESASTAMTTAKEETEAPVIADPASTATATMSQSPPCPSAYDPQKSNYIAGSQITVDCYIFRCRDEEHERYCNMSEWNESLDENDDAKEIAKEMWRTAWEKVGACVPTQGELMEEETAGAHWDCLA